MSEARDEVFQYMQYANDYYMGGGDPDAVLREALDAYVEEVRAEERGRYESSVRTYQDLRAELAETRRKLTEANAARRNTELDCARRDHTISRVRAVLPAKSERQELGLPNELAYNAGEHDMADAVREILDGTE